MMRRKPTRIEMNVEEDGQELEESKKQQQQPQPFPKTPTQATTLLHHLQGNKDSKHQRIGLSD
ncbi:hypothetical protein EJ110_NYTH52600 [Nymphaea thermarum]|nr:hypothetical protein EJ110_NYTH52600 [Nymphaea thermarum]